MTFEPSNTMESALPENVTFASEWKDYLEQWTTLYRKVASKINDKERAFYPHGYEIPNCQRFSDLNNSQVYREAFRKVFFFEAIAAGANLTIVHGIANITSLTHIYGTIKTSVPDDRPLPYTDTFIITNQVSVLRNGANIIIQNGATAPAIVTGIVVCDFLKN